MKYQLSHLLAQVRHHQRIQLESQGQYQEWTIPLEKALVKALEDLSLQEKKVQDSDWLSQGPLVEL